MYIIAVDINVSNRVVDINVTACKIMLNNFVKKYNDSPSSSKGKMEKER